MLSRVAALKAATPERAHLELGNVQRSIQGVDWSTSTSIPAPTPMSGMCCRTYRAGSHGERPGVPFASSHILRVTYNALLPTTGADPNEARGARDRSR